MRFSVVLLCAASVVGCSSEKRTRPVSPGQPAPSLGGPISPGAIRTNRNVVVTPARATTGRVASVNAPGHFVVLTFPLGTMPPAERRLNVYRAGLKVGEVKISGAPLDINIVADIVAGECQKADEVREE